jgi:putative Mg2+ transporter-C (MgtC) family protein
VTVPIVHVLAAVRVPGGQGLKQLGELALAFALSSLIGLEREWRQKAAGLRTHTLVGFGAALFVLVSKYGFTDVLGSRVVLDPSRVAAQVVTGVGFIGGGLIFVRSDAVRGLTTAAIVWVTAAIGMACGAGLALLALFATAAHFVVVFAYPWVARSLPSSRYVSYGLQVVYEDGRGILREILRQSTEAGYSIIEFTTHRQEHEAGVKPMVAAQLEVTGQPQLEPLAARLSDLSGVVEVTAHDLAEGPE